MKAMLLERCEAVEAAPLRAAEVPTPAPGAGEILVRVEACGVCHTDLHVVEGELGADCVPVIPGHEVIGTVAAPPSSSPERRVRAGNSARNRYNLAQRRTTVVGPRRPNEKECA